MSLRDPQNLLFLQFEESLGTAVIATATFRHLKQTRPELRVTVAAAGTPYNLATANPDVDEALEAPNPLHNFVGALTFARRALRPRRHDFDTVLIDSGNQRTRVIAFAIATGIARRRGYAVRPWLLHDALSVDPADSVNERNLRLLENLGIPPVATEPSIHFAAADLQHAQTLLAATASTASTAAPRIAMVTQSAKGAPNEWFADRFAGLAHRLARELGAELIFVGTRGDIAAIDALRAQIGLPTRSVAGDTTPRQLAALLAQCDCAITIDTGVMHVGRGVDLPMVVLANAAQPVRLWLPPADLDRYLLLRHDEVPCAGCMRYHCATRECMAATGVDAAFTAVTTLLARFPPGPQARETRTRARTV